MSFFGSRQVSFAEAFPEIEAMDVTISVSKGVSGFEAKDVRSYSMSSPPPATIRCTGKCSDGKHDIERAIQRAVAKGGGDVEEGAMCRDNEPMGRGQYRSCCGNFMMRGSLKLKSKKEKPPESSPRD